MKLQKIATIVSLMGVGALTHGQAQSVIDLTSGDPGGGLTLLANDAGAVDFNGNGPVTIQGDVFSSAFAPGQGSGSNAGTYYTSYNGSSLGADANDTALTSLLTGAEYQAGGTFNSITSSPYSQYIFTGLTGGQTYQLDVFNTADAGTPRGTNIDVIGSTATGIQTFNTPTSAQVIQYDLTPDSFGDITVDFGWDGGDVGGSGNSGIVNGLALTYATVPEPSSVFLMSAGLCVLLAVGLKRRLA